MSPEIERCTSSSFTVEGDGDPQRRSFRQNQTNRTLQISQGNNSKKSKLIRFLHSSLDSVDTSHDHVIQYLITFSAKDSPRGPDPGKQEVIKTHYYQENEVIIQATCCVNRQG